MAERERDREIERDREKLRKRGNIEQILMEIGIWLKMAEELDYQY